MEILEKVSVATLVKWDWGKNRKREKNNQYLIYRKHGITALGFKICGARINTVSELGRGFEGSLS